MSHRSREKMPGGHLIEKKGNILKDNSFAREIKEMPDHSNAETRKVEQRLGPFVSEADQSA